jgi:hypothetical protein
MATFLMICFGVAVGSWIPALFFKRQQQQLVWFGTAAAGVFVFTAISSLVSCLSHIPGI